MSTPIEKLTHPLKVIKKINETPEAQSIVLEIPDELKSKFTYKPGQFVTFFLKVNGEDLNRSYSLSSSPLVDNDFQVTVKRVEGGRGSNYLIDQIHEGDTLRVTPPAGHFYSPPSDLNGRHYVLFAAGSGITPVFSVLKSVLVSNDKNHVTLIYANRNEDGIIYKDELDLWINKYPKRLQVLHILSRPDSSWCGPTGRCSSDYVNATLDEELKRTPSLKAEYFLCGPVGFMDMARDTLLDRGVSTDQIHAESFGETFSLKPSAHPAGESKEASCAVGDDGQSVCIGERPETSEKPEKIIAVLDGETVEVEADEDESILEALMNAGHNPPYSCMEGTCMACMGKIKEGRVYQEDPGILTDENIEECEALTCQARPLSKVVRVDYDDF